MQILTDFLINIGYVRATDTFPSTVVEKRDLVTINAAEFVSVTIHSVPVSALFDQEIAVPEHKRAFVRITIDLAA